MFFSDVAKNSIWDLLTKSSVTFERYLPVIGQISSFFFLWVPILRFCFKHKMNMYGSFLYPVCFILI